ncbi:hypothetical protein TVNIR_3237 [Thioalkalivibrio nitratireducens DSM 14787]|uniref:Uncharacterized protein n=1 Tax=Thioalkalivibrio nitratireducens (strain DSM 14787 / UNIQEM 213 / ALEN2) TaxID=1255043 RepID=L0DZ83_THIND|nr:hypothetical protein [Thioalkalivibrio nitratireducens]AGA34874.1 hypothetical protein TVNIR_3237 [Thioalkalivibrio nitratireducens DSM 14787]
MPISILTRGVLVLLLLGVASVVHADYLRPMVLAYAKPGTDVEAEVATVRERLGEAGFRILGDYSVTDSSHVLVATSPALLEVAASMPRAAYIAPLRVAVTRVDGEVQVSYNHLEYFRHAYRIDRSLEPVMAVLADALGALESFGAEGLSPSVLSRYRYAFGMERFNDPYELAHYPDREAALAALGANLGESRGGVREVYRVDMPGRDATLIGVAIREDAGAERNAADAHQLATVDVGDRRHTAYVPYEILVEGGRVEALHMRFRMALHFPDLRMVGENSFVQLRRSPAAVERALSLAAGG